MGRPGRTPILQLGGVQDAVMVVPPRLARAVALLLPVVLVVLLKAATSGLVVLQVRGGVRGGVVLAVPCRACTAGRVGGKLPPLCLGVRSPDWASPACA